MTADLHSRQAAEPLPLIPTEISVDPPCYQSPAQKYRFRSCLEERTRWLRVVRRLVPDTRILDRFQACGHAAYVEQNDLSGAYRVRSSACKVRICPACRHIHQERVYDRICGEFEQQDRRDLKFITLTMKHSKAPLAQQLRNLRSNFRKLRNRQLWKRHVHGGFGVIELSFSASDRCWHPHIHILCRSTYVPQQQLRKAWLSITRTSFIVDIRPVSSKGRAAEYIAKYVAKVPDLDKLDNPDARYAELFQALYQGHLLITFGRHQPIRRKPRTTDESLGVWQHVCELGELLSEAKAGKSDAWDILAKLTPYDRPWIETNILTPQQRSKPPPRDLAWPWLYARS